MSECSDGPIPYDKIAAVAINKSPIEVALSDLSQAINAAEDEFMELRTKLEPCLSPEMNAVPKGDNSPRAQVSPMAHWISDLHDRVLILKESLRDVRERTEV